MFLSRFRLIASTISGLLAVRYCARYQAKPTEKHLTAVKRIFRYLKDTINMGLWYPKDTGFELTDFSDSDHAGCLDSRKSTSGGIQFLGGDKLVSWSSKKQDCTSISSAEISLSFKKIYKPTNNNLRTSLNTSRTNHDNSPKINRGTGYDNQRLGNVAGARETVGTTVVQKSGIQCYNCKEFGHVARECQKPKRAKDAAYHREKMLLCKQKEAGIQLNAEQADWRDDTDDESEDQELKAHYMYMNDDDDDLANERELLASLIGKLKCEIDDRKNRNKFLETSNKVLVDKLKGEIEDFKNKNKSLESSNNHFKEANNKLSETNKLIYNDLKKSQAELDKRSDVEYASKVEIDCAKAKGDLISYKIESQKSFNKYTQHINDLNQTISEMQTKLSTH
nr:uncharacterized mitochondrial protein AtMg00810-like [Tanacetum cinerariifolium]